MSSLTTLFHEQLARLAGKPAARMPSGQLTTLPGATRPISHPTQNGTIRHDLTAGK